MLRNVDGRWQFGLTEIDTAIRGVGPGELMYVTGRTHSGKTQVLLHGLLHNADRPQLLITPDETAELVLAKLVSWLTNANAEAIEARVREGNEKAMAEIRRVAQEHLSKLLVVDQVSSLEGCDRALREAEDYFGEPVQAVVLDYLALFGDGDGEFGDVASKSKAVKRWIKDINKPGIVVHQGTRSNAGKGQKLGLEAMSHAGENEAIFVLGVRRKRDDEKLEDWERLREQDTITVNVIKNKRPPSKRIEQDYFLDPTSGRIRPIFAADRQERAATLHEAPVPERFSPRRPGEEMGRGDAIQNRELFDRAGF